jgi:hypothetical protein
MDRPQVVSASSRARRSGRAAIEDLGRMARVRSQFSTWAKMVTGVTPDRVSTDGHDSYPRAIRTTLGVGVRHRDSQYLNNRLEQDHRGVKGRYGPMRGFKCPRSAGEFCAPTTSCATSSVPAPEPISKSPPTTVGSTSFAAPQQS